MASRQCKNDPQKFCYVCGKFSTLRNISEDTKKLYKLYFGVALADQDKPWAPHKIHRLLQWTS